ncbi:ATP-binding protein [Geovibrio thiophilus]|uniref:ATP-binding protein n=1 Tax=Geovibrio thiophilus TaxID=139438 RepID=A0A410K0X9_9BACT|nr:ATP-binding protein [Geovibrio thiophilus]QAR34023.1 ATP-binding protein [Geovibrio thiophilus]
MYQRTMEKVLKQVSKSFPVVLVTGPRQVGKTTLLEMCAAENMKYVSLDDLDVRSLAQNDPGLFIQTYTPSLIIDEIQYAPQLFSYIKIAVDREKQNGMFWLTGSQKFHLMKGITESLAGRVAVLDLLGLSNAEINHTAENSKPFLPDVVIEQANGISLTDAYRKIWFGSFPRVIDNPDVRDIFYRSYIQTYIQRDVKDILNITDEITFHKFLGAIAARTGQLLNYADVARDVAIDNKTVKAWLSVLEASGLVYLLYPYHTNVTKRIIKTPKIYFLDTGLCSYLTKWTTPEALEAGAMSGAIFETYVVAEILKSYWHTGQEANLYFYRDTDQKEVDLLIESNNTLYPIEIKKTATPSKTAVRSFDVLNKLNKQIGHGAVICLTEKNIPISGNVTAISVENI